MPDDKVGKGFILGGFAVISSSVPYIMGFTTSGVAKASIAAWIQSTIGNVAGGSLFAMAQSVTATTVLGTAAPIVVAGAGAGAIVYGVYRISKSKEIEKMEFEDRSSYMCYE